MEVIGDVVGVERLSDIHKMVAERILKKGERGGESLVHRRGERSGTSPRRRWCERKFSGSVTVGLLLYM